MMGYHGLRLLLRLAEEALAENEQHRRGTVPPASRGREYVYQELRLLYARGEIDHETFLELRPRAERGELSATDLEEARRQTARTRAIEPPEAREVSRALARLQERGQALERARSDSEATARRLEEQLADLEAQAGRADEEARQVVLTDEARARSILERQQSTLEQVERLRASVRSLRDDIQRLDDLRQQLTLQEQELEAGRARARLDALEREIRGHGTQ